MVNGKTKTEAVRNHAEELGSGGAGEQGCGGVEERRCRGAK